MDTMIEFLKADLAAQKKRLDDLTTFGCAEDVIEGQKSIIDSIEKRIESLNAN